MFVKRGRSDSRPAVQTPRSDDEINNDTLIASVPDYFFTSPYSAVAFVSGCRRCSRWRWTLSDSYPTPSQAERHRPHAALPRPRHTIARSRLSSTLGWDNLASSQQTDDILIRNRLAKADATTKAPQSLSQRTTRFASLFRDVSGVATELSVACFRGVHDGCHRSWTPMPRGTWTTSTRAQSPISRMLTARARGCPERDARSRDPDHR